MPPSYSEKVRINTVRSTLLELNFLHHVSKRIYTTMKTLLISPVENFVIPKGKERILSILHTKEKKSLLKIAGARTLVTYISIAGEVMVHITTESRVVGPFPRNRYTCIQSLICSAFFPSPPFKFRIINLTFLDNLEVYS